MERQCTDSGLGFVFRLDAAGLLGRIDQSYFAASTVTGPGGQPLSATAVQNDASVLATINASAGACWRPPACACLRVFLGYEFEHWWYVGNLADQTQGEVVDQGVLLRADFNY